MVAHFVFGPLSLAGRGMKVLLWAEGQSSRNLLELRGLVSGGTLKWVPANVEKPIEADIVPRTDDVMAPVAPSEADVIPETVAAPVAVALRECGLAERNTVDQRSEQESTLAGSNLAAATAGAGAASMAMEAVPNEEINMTLTAHMNWRKESSPHAPPPPLWMERAVTSIRTHNANEAAQAAVWAHRFWFSMRRVMSATTLRILTANPPPEITPPTIDGATSRPGANLRW